jgi:hypothetical protein
LAIALCLTPATLAAQANRSALPVVVVVADTLRGPIASASVSVAGAQNVVIQGVTDERGLFVTRIDVAGAYDVNVRRLGFAPNKTHIRIAGGDSVTVTVMLTPLAVRIGPVVVSDTRLPLDKRPFIESQEIASSRRALFSLNDVMGKLRARIDYQRKQHCLDFPPVGPIQDGVVPQSAIPKSRLRAWIFVRHAQPGIRLQHEIRDV